IVSDGPGTCHQAADYAPLARLPRGRVLGFIDAGPFLLMQTPHEVLAAPYHRNIKGNGAMFDVFLGPVGEAQQRLARSASITWHSAQVRPNATLMPKRHRAGLPRRWDGARRRHSWSVFRLTEHHSRFTGPGIDCGLDAGWPGADSDRGRRSLHSDAADM